MKRRDIAETTAIEALESRFQAVEQHVAAVSASVSDAMRTMGDAFKAMTAESMTFRGLRVVDSEGRTIAAIGPGGGGGGTLVLYDPETGSEVAFAPPSLDKRTLDGDKPSADAGMGKPRDEGRISDPRGECDRSPGR